MKFQIQGSRCKSLQQPTKLVPPARRPEVAQKGDLLEDSFSDKTLSGHEEIVNDSSAKAKLKYRLDNGSDRLEGGATEYC